MKSFKYVITDPVGIHARPASALVKCAKELGGTITVTANGKSAEATKLMALMSLGIKNGMEVTVEVNGDNEDEAAAKLEQFFIENL